MQVELAQLRYRLPRLRGRGIAAEPAGCAASAPAVPVRRSSRSTAGASCAGSRKLERDLERLGRDRAPRSARPARRRDAPDGRARRLHERGEVDAAEPAHRRRRARRGPAVLHARPHHPAAAAPGGETVLLLRHRRVRAPPAAPARRGVPVDARGGRRRRPARARGRRPARPTPRRRSTPCTTVLREIGAGDVPELLVFNKADVADARRREGAARRAPGRGRGVGGHRRGRRRAPGHDRRPAARARSDRGARWCRTTGATCSPRCTATARCSWRCTARAARGCGPGCPRATLHALRRVRRRPDADVTDTRAAVPTHRLLDALEVGGRRRSTATARVAPGQPPRARRASPRMGEAVDRRAAVLDVRSSSSTSTDEPLRAPRASRRCARSRTGEVLRDFVMGVRVADGAGASWCVGRRRRRSRDRRRRRSSRVICTFADVTDASATPQQALRASEERFRLLAENAADVMYRITVGPVAALRVREPGGRVGARLRAAGVLRRPGLVVRDHPRRRRRASLRELGARSGSTTVRVGAAAHDAARRHDDLDRAPRWCRCATPTARSSRSRASLATSPR